MEAGLCTHIMSQNGHNSQSYTCVNGTKMVAVVTLSYIHIQLFNHIWAKCF